MRRNLYSHIVKCVLIHLLSLNLIFCEPRGIRGRYETRKCEKLSITMCEKVGYNLTFMPNKYGHVNQIDAGQIIRQFAPLVAINCSPLLAHFVCSLYAPMCDPVYNKDIVPCQSLCENIRNSCEKFMKQNGYIWPDNLICSQFPTREQDPICMKPDSDFSEPSIPTHSNLPDKNKITPIIQTKDTFKIRDFSGCGCLCKYPFVGVNSSSNTDLVPPCVLPCGQYFFSNTQNIFMKFWLSLWSILSLITTAVTLLTFFIDRTKFKFVEQPIILISFCYFIVSFGYIIRLIYGFKAIACNDHTGFLHYAATGPASCTAVFILTYFFTNVSWIWWVVLSINWFLSSGLKWTNGTISSYSQYFHFVAWLIPTIQTMAILAMSAIDGDPVSGLCTVGNHDSNTLTIFVIGPLLIYTMLSLSFFIAGAVAKLRIEQTIRNEAKNNLKTARFLSRVGMFTFILFVPAVSLLGCYFYEHSYKEIWEKSANCDCMPIKKQPIFYIFLFKYLMSLVTGIAIGLGTLNSDALSAWRSFFKRHCKITKSLAQKNGQLIPSNSKNGVAI